MVLLVALVLVAVFVGTRSRSGEKPAAPPRPVVPLPAELQFRVRELAGRGQKIQSIKEVREKLGLSLLDAKNAVDAVADGRAVPVPPRPVAEERRDLADRARALAAAGRRDEAIGLVAYETGMSAPEADAFVRALLP